MNLCKYLSCLFLAAAIAFAAVLATFYIGEGGTELVVRMGYVELCLIVASFVTFIGSR